MNLSTRRIIISSVLGILTILMGYGMFKGLSAQKQPSPTKPAADLTKIVSVMKAKNESHSSSVNVQGQLQAYNKINLSVEVAGKLNSTSKPFKVGTYFPKGSLIFDIENTENRMAILSQKSALMNAITSIMPDLKIDYPQSFAQWESYLKQFDVNAPLKAFPAPINDQEKFFIASRNLQTQYYNILSQEERLAKYRVYAPFSGVITQALTNTGAIVSPGQKLGELMNTNTYELPATMALNDLGFLKVGQSVKLYSSDISGEWTGKVIRISDQIDPQTQTAQVFIKVSGEKLKEGMYLRGGIASRGIESAVKVPRSYLINQNQLFLVPDSTLQLVDIQVIKIEGTEAYISGIQDGANILSTNLSNPYNGMKVNVK